MVITNYSTVLKIFIVCMPFGHVHRINREKNQSFSKEHGKKGERRKKGGENLGILLFIQMNGHKRQTQAKRD